MPWQIIVNVEPRDDKSSVVVEEITADDQVAKIFEWRRGFNAMHLIDLGVRLGLFSAFILFTLDKKG